MVDDEYIDNWVSPEKFDLLCEPKWKVGMIGSAYFVGVALFMLISPPYADKNGRRNIFIFFLFVRIVA